MSLPVSLLLKKLLSSGVVPGLWKSTFITPVHKKGSKSDVLNYRPVSKLCFIAKIFERIIYNQLYPAVVKSLSPFQHGFVKGLLTITNLIMFIDCISGAMDSGRQVDVIHTDYSKAFDRTDNFILNQKLNNIGIRGDILRWF